MPETPLEWLTALDKKLEDRRSRIDTFADYYHGRHRLQFTSAKFRKAFGHRFAGFADNWCRPVVDAKAERLTVQGFKMSADQAADPEAWRIWQYNQLDAWSGIAHTEAMVSEQAYALVWPDENGGELPRITIEHPSQMIVATAAGDRTRRLAALKKWLDDSGYVFATVYLPDGIHKFQSERPVKDGNLASQRITWTSRDEGDITHRFGVVPVVPLRNRPSLLEEAESELTDVIPHQNAVNNLWANLLVAAEHHAVRRPWVMMAELPQDEAGNPVNPLAKDLDSVALEGEGSIGTLEETDLDGFLKAIEHVVQHIASQAAVPPHYLNASADRLSGESIKAAETGLVARVTRKQHDFGEAWEETIRLAFRIMGQEQWAAANQAEVDWKDAESRTESQHADAVAKYVESLKLPYVRAWEKVGESPQQIQRNLQLLAQQQLLFEGTDVAALLDEADGS